MQKRFYLILVLVLSIGIIIGFSVNASAQTTSIPKWIKNTALLWGQGQVSDDEFINAIQWLIDQGYLKIYTPTKPISASPVQSTDQSDLTITKRSDGTDAVNKISQITDANKLLSNDEIIERINRDPSNSQFALAIVTLGQWQGALSDGSSLITISGYGTSLIPFDCAHIGSAYYNANAQKMTDAGKLNLGIFKNGILIDGGTTTASYGLVSLTGDCTNPDVSNNLKKLNR